MSDPSETRPSRILMISGDCHAGPPQPGYRDYFDSHRDDFDAYCRSRAHPEAAEAALAGDLEAIASQLAAFMVSTGGGPEEVRAFSERALTMSAGLFDSKARQRCLDEDGIAAEVIFPDGFVDNQPPFSDAMETDHRFRRLGRKHHPFELRLAGARAYNRWLADFCAEDPDRRAGVVFLPPAHDIGALVEELRRARLSGLRGGFVIPPIEDGLPGYHDPLYEPLWSAAVDLDMPVTVHGGNGVAADAVTTYGAEEPLASILHFTECTLFDRRPLWYFLWGGVFERHPRLKLVIAEGLAHWVPQELHRLDEMYEMWNLKTMREKLPLRPSEYWARHGFLTASFISRAEAEMRHALCLPNLMWGSDYPHPEGTWPYTETCLQHALHGIPESEQRQILGENALRVYDFDAAKLEALAGRIGPAARDLAEPPESLPTDYVGMGLR